MNLNINDINIGDFITFDKNLNNFIQCKIAVDLNSDENILKEISLEILRKVISKFYNNKNVDFIDIRDNNHFNSIKKLTNEINSYNYKNFITNARIGSELEDSSGYNFSASTYEKKHIIYNTGSLGKKYMYIDMYKKWTAYDILLFNKMSINIENINAHPNPITNPLSPFSIKYLVTFDIAYDVNDINDSLILNVIDNDNDDALRLAISLKRENKLNTILNEE